MHSSVGALLSELIDYAGLFPPAKLDMPATVRAYAEHRRGPYAWMLGRLIVPAGRLQEFEAAAANHVGPADDPWRLSVIAAAASDPTALDADLERIERFHDRRDARRINALIDSIELKAANAAEVDDALDMVPEELDLFIEIPVRGDVRGVVAALAGSEAAAKVRTGGATADMFPTAAELARFLSSCAMADVPFKATAGLHHPFPRASGSAPGAREHGFLNLFLGAALARSERIGESELETLLVDESAASFTLSDDRMEWRGRSAQTDEIAAARNEFALSYGSCSFEEPIEDLKAAGLL